MRLLSSLSTSASGTTSADGERCTLSSSPRSLTRSDTLIVWPNADSTWTLSHRTASSTVMPVLVGSPSPDDPSSDSSGQVRVVPALSSANTADKPCVVTFERLLALEDGDKYGGKEAGLEKKANQVRRAGSSLVQRCASGLG